VRSERWGNAGLVLVSVLVSVLLIEVGFRLQQGLPLTKFHNWRTFHVAMTRLGHHAEFEPTLGWQPKPNYSSDTHNTLNYGIRRNFQETELRLGHVLAVGDSFTEGWEVDDDDSWPAYLELMSGTPIVNGGVGGYGTDQIIMRAERLLPIVRPQTLIVGFLSFDVFRTGHSQFGAPKPWFTVDNGNLIYHPPPTPEPEAEPGLGTRVWRVARDVIGHSAAVDFIMARASQDLWYGNYRSGYVKADNDPVRVTCLLLERLKKQTDAMGVRAMLFMQYYAPAIMFEERPPEEARQVMDCAAKTGFEVVDHFPSLKTLSAANPMAMREFYFNDGDTFRHMTSDGNEHAAAVLLKALRKQATSATR
jgi:hypothetical protein